MDARIVKNGGQILISMDASTKQLGLALCRVVHAGTNGTRGVIYIDFCVSYIVVKADDATSGIVLDFLVTMRGREGPHVFDRHHHPFFLID
jgi:hypothetical protein